MSTTMMPVDPAMSAQRANRLLSISANLLPEEVTLARRARRTRGWVLIVAGVAALLLGGWFFVALQEKSSADSELTDATAAVVQLQRDQSKFSEVVKVQNDTAALTKQLKAAMGDDLDWAALITMLRAGGASVGLEVEGINGTLKTAEGGDASSTGVGSLVITGTSPDKETVAAYIDLLNKQKTVSDPYITAVTQSDDNNVTFSATVDIAESAKCGRFSDTKCSSQEGK